MAAGELLCQRRLAHVMQLQNQSDRKIVVSVRIFCDSFLSKCRCVFMVETKAVQLPANVVLCGLSMLGVRFPSVQLEISCQFTVDRISSIKHFCTHTLKSGFLPQILLSYSKNYISYLGRLPEKF